MSKISNLTIRRIAVDVFEQCNGDLSEFRRLVRSDERLESGTGKVSALERMEQWFVSWRSRKVSRPSTLSESVDQSFPRLRKAVRDEVIPATQEIVNSVEGISDANQPSELETEENATVSD